ncbi:fungal-specific transcription factor domain-containing protein [Mycena albidolilacea]|uniref:Fungal-specific transcription factor domain-containing protein n=1 Tax=Mycena albidolilacea TaxID=1033008 RepID=A0AAD7AT76_9AGAR|nr:fungal-specific transcription factor domain-containing protein [Mycena albidolilacea]
MEAPAQTGKRRRLQGSCDACKKRKVRCNSAEMPGNRCTNCITTFIECTRAGKSLPSPDSPKTGQEHVAAILSTTIVYVPSHDHNVNHRILVEVAGYARSLEERLAAPPQLHSFVPTATSPNPSSLEESLSPNASEDATSTDAEQYRHTRNSSTDRSVSVSKKADRFYGLSSGVQFIKAMRLMNGVVGVQRPEFWNMPPWEVFTLEVPRQVFPEDDLLQSLVTIYFEQINPILGILHFPTFQQSISDGLHLRDREFGAVVLAVCSLASRNSDDPRVFIEGTNSEHSCGWKWFRQARPFCAPFSRGTSLYQLQLICLSAIFTSGVAIPEEGWILAGLGIRLAQCAGAHHRGGYRKMEPLAAELYRRVFWILVVADTLMSSFNGRPSITKPFDFDVDFPTGCDEEWWGLPNAMQPAGKPSTAAFMPVYLQLMVIFGRIQRAVYSVNGPVRLHEEMVDLDSELNKWVDIIPEHLRWNPHQQNQIFLDQSAVLYTTYYHAQILIHRPFIPAPGKESISSTTQFPSLAICANAARSCGHVLDVQARRGRGLLHYPGLLTALFDSAVVLLVNVWAVVGGRKPRTPDDFARATADTQNCVRVLRLYERRWRTAGRDCDIISAMLNIGKQWLKRPREVEEEEIPVSASPYVPDDSLSLSIGGSSDHSIQEAEQQLFSLPLLTDELGRLPVYDSFDYGPRFEPNELHHPVPSYLDSERDLLEPELLFGVEPALDSIFSLNPQQDGITGGVENIQLTPNPMSFDIPSSDSWQDWSRYLESLDGLNRRTF